MTPPDPSSRPAPRPPEATPTPGRDEFYSVTVEPDAPHWIVLHVDGAAVELRLTWVDACSLAPAIAHAAGVSAALLGVSRGDFTDKFVELLRASR